MALGLSMWVKPGNEVMVLALQDMCCYIPPHVHTHTHQHVKPGAPYFTVEFDEGPNLLMKIKGRFPLQFGR